MKLILDTNAWYAYIIKPDKFHHAATTIIKENPYIYIPYPVLEELSALTHYRLGKKITQKSVYPFAYHSSRSEIVYVNAQDDQEIWEIYNQTQSKLSYVDASVVWLSRKLDLPIFTFDRHLRHPSLNLNYLPQ